MFRAAATVVKLLTTVVGIVVVAAVLMDLPIDEPYFSHKPSIPPTLEKPLMRENFVQVLLECP